MKFTCDSSHRSFLSALGAFSGSLFAPLSAKAEELPGHKIKAGAAAGVGGSTIVPITSGLGSTDIFSGAPKA